MHSVKVLNYGFALVIIISIIFIWRERKAYDYLEDDKMKQIQNSLEENEAELLSLRAFFHFLGFAREAGGELVVSTQAFHHHEWGYDETQAPFRQREFKFELLSKDQHVSTNRQLPKIIVSSLDRVKPLFRKLNIEISTANEGSEAQLLFRVKAPKPKSN